MIEVDGISYYYSDFLAVDNISFQVDEHESVALLGLNGAGKTTTLRLLAGFLSPARGHIKIDATDVVESSLHARTLVGYLPETPALYNEMSVEDFLKYLYRLRMHTRKNEDRAVKDAMQKTGIEHKASQYIQTLSAGYKKRVGLAQALVHNPPALILDEPVSDLDPRQIVEIRNLIKELKQEHTILISSHILSEVAQTADRYLFIHEGRLVAQESAQSLASKMPANVYELKINGPQEQINNLLQQIQSMNNVAACRIIEEQRSSAACTIHIDAKTDIRKEISKAVIDTGLDLLEIHTRANSLESIFLELVGHEAA